MTRSYQWLPLAALLVLATQAFAQTQPPSPEQMIEQLRAVPVLRSLRNLTVDAAKPSLTLNIQFDFDSAHIRPQSYQPLGNLAVALASPELLQSRFLIEGHTDAKGSADYNQRLSEQRAMAIKDLLVSKGVDAQRLVSVGKGASEPANPDAPLAAENRRVKIVNLD